MIRMKEAREIKGQTNPEQWFLEQLRAYTQRQPRGDKTPDCPDDSFLRAYAAKPGSFPLSDSRVRHVTSCDHCMPALLDFRSATTTRRPLQMRVAAVTSLCATCLIAGFLGARYWSHRQSIAVEPPALSREVSPPMERTLDLTNYGTFRGAEDQSPRPPVNLPAALLHVNLILPRFSEAGPYTIMVVGD